MALILTTIGFLVVCQDHTVGNFNGLVEPIKNAKMMSWDTSGFLHGVSYALEYNMFSAVSGLPSSLPFLMPFSL